MIYNKKLKPLLIDKNILGEYVQQKMTEKIQYQTQLQQNEIGEIIKKGFYNTINFIYNYFFLIGILVGIGYYFYNRYNWYQTIKKEKEKELEKEKEIQQYFDSVMEQQQPAQKQIIIEEPPQTMMPGYGTGKLDKMVMSNNNYLNYMKDTIATTKTCTTSMGPIGRLPIPTQNKTVRFVTGSFDAYGRNNINPKTGEILKFI